MENKKRKSENYDRNNNISVTGTTLTRSAKTSLRNLCHQLFYQGRRNLKFFTFTLPPTYRVEHDFEAFQSDSFYNACLSRLLENLKKNYGLKDYFWVAERQEKNGRGAIHYHCVFDVNFLSAQHLCFLWCQQLKEYHVKSRNCVEYAEIKTLKSLANYVSKYISKNGSRIYASSWRATHGYSRIAKTGKIVISDFQDLATMATSQKEIIVNEKELLNNSHAVPIYVTCFFFPPEYIAQRYQKEFKIPMGIYPVYYKNIRARDKVNVLPVSEQLLQLKDKYI
jgi:hypothetical protein